MAYKNDNVKKIIFIALLVLFLAGPVFAQEFNYPTLPGAQAPQDFLKTAEPEDIPGLWVKYVINLATWSAGMIALLALIWGGIKFLTSTGKPDKIIEARKQISSAFLGLAIILTAYFVLETISPYFINFTLPNLEKFSLIEVPVPPSEKEQASSIDTYIPFGRIIENIFQTYISNPEEAEKTEEGPVVPETLTRIQRILNTLDAADQLLPPIAQRTSEIRDLSKDCECWRNTLPDPRCTSCGSCPAFPPLCTCDPCKKSRSEIVKTENDLLPYLFGVSNGTDGFSNLIGNVQLLGGVGELEGRIGSGDTAGIEDTVEGVDALGGVTEFENLVDSVGGLDRMEDIINGVDKIGGIEQLERVIGVIDAMGGTNQFSTVVSNFGGLDNLKNILNIVEKVDVKDFGSLINNIEKIGGMPGFEDVINKSGGLDELEDVANVIIELGGMDELKGIIDKVDNADNFGEMIDAVRAVGGIDAFGDVINNVLNVIGIDELEILLNKAGGADKLEDVIDIMRETTGDIEEFRNMFVIVDALGGIDGIEKIVNAVSSADSLADALDVITFIGGMDIFKNRVQTGDITGIEDTVETVNKLGGIDELEKIINQAGNINNLSDLMSVIRKIGGFTKFKEITQTIDSLGGLNELENIINKAGSVDSLSDVINLVKQANGIPALRNILQNVNALGGLSELEKIINKAGGIENLSGVGRVIRNMGSIQNFDNFVQNIGGLSQLQNAINLVNTAGGINQLSDIINKINALGGVTELQNIINSAGGTAQLQNIITTAAAVGGVSQLSNIIEGVNTLGGPTNFGTMLDLLGNTSLGEIQGIDGVFQHDAYGLPYTITTNLTTEITKLEEEVRLLKIWFDRLAKAQKFIESCDWVALNNRNQFFQKKDEFEAKGWVIEDVAFYDDLEVVLNVPDNPTNLTQRWHPRPGTKLKEMADESTLYCAVGGTYVIQPSDYKLGLTPPDPFENVSDNAIEDYLENEDLFTYEMACDITIPFGEILDKAHRMARLLVNNLELILDREKRIVEAAGELQRLVSQCSSRLCFPLCICIPPPVDVCIEIGCFGPACPKGDIGDEARNIEQYVREIQAADTVVRQIFNQAPDILQGMQDSLRNHMTKCTLEKEVGADVVFYTCDKAIGGTDEIGKMIRQCDPGTNNEWQDTLYGGCLNNCMSSKISKTPSGNPTTFFEETDYRQCVSDCMASVCIYNYNHELNFHCCHYKK